jgi:hypothetical protein
VRCFSFLLTPIRANGLQIGPGKDHRIVTRMQTLRLKRDWIYGWLLLLPALVFLFAFTHIPAVTTLLNSFFSTPRGRRPAKFIGLDNYDRMINDAVFWKVLWNNLWFALGTIPVSVALAIVMALWVNEKLAGRSFVRMAYFTPTVLPLIAVANIWLFFYTPGFRPVRPDHRLSVRLAGIQLPRQSRNSSQRHHRGDCLERSRVLHDLLSGGASGNPRFLERSGAD